MKRLHDRVRRDERGASLVLAIAFLVVAGAIGAGLTASVTSGINDATVLALARNRDYAAEGAIDYAIVDVQQGKLGADGTGPVSPLTSIGLSLCGPYSKTLTLRGSQTIGIRVDCTPAPEITADLAARNNVIFVACVDTGPPCDDTTAIIRAEINYQVSGTPPAVTSTHVQTWSVKG